MPPNKSRSLQIKFPNPSPMTKRAVLLLLLCSAIIPSSIAQLKKPKKETKALSLFTLGGKPTTADEFIYLYKKNHQNKQDDFTNAKIEEYLDLFIKFKLKVTEAKKRGMDTTAAFRKEYNQYREELRRPYLPDAHLTDSLVRLTYNRFKEEVNASHILINLKPEATPEDTLRAYTKAVEIRNKIKSGQDFGEAAVVYSEDPSAKINKGNLGYFTAMQMVYAFETAAYSTPVGEISQPVRSRFGYHLVYVVDRRPTLGEVEVSHIMIRTGDDKDNAKAKNSIFEIYDQLQAGVKWEDLCKQFSEDPGSKDNGGKLRPFGIGVMRSVQGFEQVAFFLTKPGEISDPFQSQYGWHIMRLEAKIPFPSFEEMSPSLKTRVTRDERTQVSKQAIQLRLRKDFQFTENLAVRTKVFALADSSLQQGTWKIPPYPNATQEVLFSLTGKPVVVNDFLAYVKSSQRPTTLAPEKYFEQLYNNYVDVRILQGQEEKIIRENPDYSFLLLEYYEGILLFEIMEKEVWNKASEDSTGQHKYYDTHTASYQAGERVDAALYYSGSPDFIEDLRALLLQGDEKKIQEFVSTRKIKTESGFYKKDDKAILQKVPWTAGIHTSENNGMYYLARLKAILPPGTMSFEEARPTVISDYQTYLEKNWLDQLKKKYPVKVNGKGKQYVLSQLQQP